MRQNHLVDHVIILHWGLLTRCSAIRGRTVYRERAASAGAVPLLSDHGVETAGLGVTQPPQSWVFSSPRGTPSQQDVHSMGIQTPPEAQPAPERAGPLMSHHLPASLHFQLVLLRRDFRQVGPALRESTSFPGLTCPLRASPLFSQTLGSRLTQGCPETPGSTPGAAQCCPRPRHLQGWREQPSRPQSSAPL